MPKPNSHNHRPISGNSSPDISQLVTARLTHHRLPSGTPAQQLAQHEAEIQRLLDLEGVLEQAITALVIRSHIAPDHEQRDALAHSRTDLQRYKDEVTSHRAEHERAVGHLRLST